VVKFKETTISITCTFHRIEFRWLVKTGEKCGAFATLEEDKKCIHNFKQRTRRDETT